MVRQLATDNRPQLGSFLAKLPLNIVKKHCELIFWALLHLIVRVRKQQIMRTYPLLRSIAGLFCSIHIVISLRDMFPDLLKDPHTVQHLQWHGEVLRIH